MVSIHPSIGYYDIELLLHEKYETKKIIYKLSQFNTYKQSLKKEFEFYQLRENRLDNILFEDQHLLKLKIEFFPNEKDKYQNVIRIYGTEESLKLLNDNKIGQYFIDCTYKCVPHSLNPINVLIILIAYNHINKKFELCLIATFTKEDKETFKQFYSLLKNKYNFNPKRIICEFSISNLQVLNSIFGEDNIIIITCFFHLLHCCWRKARKLG